MTRSISALALEHVAALPDPCRSCVRWELDEAAAASARRGGGTAFEKEAWLSRTLLEWGSCGRVAHVGDELAAFVTYAPPHLVPRSLLYPTSPVSADAVLLMTAGVLPQHRGAGLGRMLVQGAAKDLTRRGVRAVEAFAEVPGAEGEDAEGDGGERESGEDEAGDGGSAARRGTARSGWLRTSPPRPDAAREVGGPLPSTALGGGCHVPAAFLQEVGFEVVRDHPRWPRLRLELRTALAWREDVERALDRILAELHAPALG